MNINDPEEKKRQIDADATQAGLQIVGEVIEVVIDNTMDAAASIGSGVGEIASTAADAFDGGGAIADVVSGIFDALG